MDLTRELAGMAGKAQEQERGTRHGVMFENDLQGLVTALCLPQGDTVESVGDRVRP